MVKFGEGESAATISLVVRGRAFRWLWLMYVTGFDPRHHCQKCLKGKKTQRFKYDHRSSEIPLEVKFSLDEYPAPFVYLCGVTSRYEDNFHLALKPSLEGCVEIHDDRIDVLVTHTEQVPIDPVDADLPPSYLRCRNFQFGYHHLREPASA